MRYDQNDLNENHFAGFLYISLHFIGILFSCSYSRHIPLSAL